LKTAQKNEENRQLLEAVINYLGQNGVEAHLTVIYEGGGRTLAILLPNVRADEVIGTPSGMAPLGDKTRPTTSLTFPHPNPLPTECFAIPKVEGKKQGLRQAQPPNKEEA
jgi:hypothetical protein